MARNLLVAGHDVRAWSRTRDEAEPLADDGAVVAGTAAGVADGADFVLIMLAAGDAVLAVAAESLPAVDDAAVWVQASAIGLEATDRVIELARERGIAFVDAPVLGATHRLSRAKTT